MDRGERIRLMSADEAIDPGTKPLVLVPHRVASMGGSFHRRNGAQSPLLRPVRERVRPMTDTEPKLCDHGDPIDRCIACCPVHEPELCPHGTAPESAYCTKCNVERLTGYRYDNVLNPHPGDEADSLLPELARVCPCHANDDTLCEECCDCELALAASWLRSEAGMSWCVMEPWVTLADAINGIANAIEAGRHLAAAHGRATPAPADTPTNTPDP